jgi:hypothetical protein
MLSKISKKYLSQGSTYLTVRGTVMQQSGLIPQASAASLHTLNNSTTSSNTYLLKSSLFRFSTKNDEAEQKVSFQNVRT